MASESLPIEFSMRREAEYFVSSYVVGSHQQPWRRDDDVLDPSIFRFAPGAIRHPLLLSWL